MEERTVDLVGKHDDTPIPREIYDTLEHRFWDSGAGWVVGVVDDDELDGVAVVSYSRTTNMRARPTFVLLFTSPSSSLISGT
jgi:hypothetical protein